MLSDFIVNEIDIKGNVVVLENKPLTVKAESLIKKEVCYEMTKELCNKIVSNLS